MASSAPTAVPADGGGGTAVATATPTPTRVEIPVTAGLAIGICAAFTVVAGLVPQPFIDFARHATLLLL